MKKTSLAALCACLALALVAAGCGGSDNNDKGTAGGSSSSPAKSGGKKQATGGGGATAGKSASVTLKDIAFHPANVTVAKGGTVTWTNDDTVGHDVTKESGPGKDFKSGTPGGLTNGATFKQTFTTAGTIKYRCTVHPGMEGTITVK
jgi:plastocyanin